jgi:polysaccharide biosynthesis/export protein
MNLHSNHLRRSRSSLLRFVARFGCDSVILALLGVCGWLLPSAQAVDPPLSNSPSNTASSMPIRAAQSNALVAPSDPALIAGRSSGPNAAPATVSTTNAAPNSMAALDDKYKLAIGDRLSFRILEDEEDPKPLFVTDSGDLEVPYIGRVPAAGKTCRQLAVEIKIALEKDYYYQATVIIAVDLMSKSTAKSLGRVYLVGAVRLPGPVELPTDEVLTLSRAVLRAGGFTDYADRRHVKVTRNDDTAKDKKKTFVVDVGDIFDKGKIETDLVLEAGDLIYVPDRLIRF